MISAEEVIDIVISVSENNVNKKSFTSNSSLIGPDSHIDSMGLIQLCIALEDKATLMDFQFDWTSEKAMSTMTSIFRTPESLAQEFNRQLIDSREK